jgi:cell division protein FtsB
MMKLNRVILLVLFLMAVGLQTRLWIGESSLAHVDGLGSQVALQAAENNRKRLRNEILKAEIMDLRNGLDAIEEKARSELGLVKEGETFFLLVEE